MFERYLVVLLMQVLLISDILTNLLSAQAKMKELDTLCYQTQDLFFLY